MLYNFIFSAIILQVKLAQAHEIENVVHLMLENRGFDTIFGFLDHNREIDNLVGKEPFCNYLDPGNTTSLKVCTSNTQPLYSENEPNHMYPNVTEQLYGKDVLNDSLAHIRPAMNGFINQVPIGGWKDPNHVDTSFYSEIMAGFDPEKIPIHKTLAAEFTIFDRWFASVPGPTQPNRLFSHMATSKGIFRNDLKKFVFGIHGRTIQKDLAKEGLTWKVYAQDAPSFSILKETRLDDITNLKSWGAFHHDAISGKLANYTYLEPNYGKIGAKTHSNDGHATTYFFNCEYLVKDVYETLRMSPQWNNTLLLITYDEHGGFHDHVPPPRAPSPDGIVSEEGGHIFKFDRLGVRVPVMLISPWIAKGAVIHEPDGPLPDSQFEHSSIAATIRSLFKLKSAPLSKREEWAGRFDKYLLDKPRTDTPTVLPPINFKG